MWNYIEPLNTHGRAAAVVVLSRQSMWNYIEPSNTHGRAAQLLRLLFNSCSYTAHSHAHGQLFAASQHTVIICSYTAHSYYLQPHSTQSLFAATQHTVIICSYTAQSHAHGQTFAHSYKLLRKCQGHVPAAVAVLIYEIAGAFVCLFVYALECVYACMRACV
jgi:hypothetical protein